MTRPRHWLTALLAVTLLAGCRNPFSPASPERPAVANVRPDYSTPDNLLNTLVDAMADKGTTNGSASYSDAFAAEFVATVQPEIAAVWISRFGGQLPTWGLDQESRFYTGFVQSFPAGVYVLDFFRDVQLPLDETDESDDQVTLYRYYRIEHRDDDGLLLDVICQGDADILMTRANGRFQITRWADHFDRTVGANPNDERLSWGSRRYEAY